MVEHLGIVESTRTLLDELARRTVDPDTAVKVADLIRQAADLMSGGGEEPEGPGSLERARQLAYFEHFGPFAGDHHPLAPPIQLSIVGEQVEGLVTYGKTFEGPPGFVHGGFIAGAFDEVLSFAAVQFGAPGMTGRLTVAYRSPTPLHEPVRYVARVEHAEGRRTAVAGELRVAATGRLCAESTGLFVSVGGRFGTEARPPA